jgi:hypothetical protein
LAHRQAWISIEDQQLSVRALDRAGAIFGGDQHQAEDLTRAGSRQGKLDLFAVVVLVDLLIDPDQLKDPALQHGREGDDGQVAVGTGPGQ